MKLVKGDFPLSLSKKCFNLGKGNNVEEKGDYEGISILITTQLLSLGSGPNKSQRNAMSLFN